jgi:peroxiredoxin
MVDEDNGEMCDDGATTGTGDTPCINNCKVRHPWPIDPCHASTFPTTDANEVNAVAFNFTIQDQNGIDIRLHDFCDRVVVLTTIAAWSDPDGELANQLGELYSGLKDQGLMVVTLMIQNFSQEPPSESDLTDWAETHNLQHPVAADPDIAVAEMFGVSSSNGSLALPFNVVIRRGMIIDAIDINPTEEMLRNLTNQ